MSFISEDVVVHIQDFKEEVSGRPSCEHLVVAYTINGVLTGHARMPAADMTLLPGESGSLHEQDQPYELNGRCSDLSLFLYLARLAWFTLSSARDGKNKQT